MARPRGLVSASTTRHSPPKRQDLHQRLEERGPAGVLLRQAQAEDGRGGRRPLRADQPAGQAAERDQGQRPEHRRDQRRRGHAVDPPAAREQDGQPRHELRRDPRPGRRRARGGRTRGTARRPNPVLPKRQPGMRPAERGQRLGDGQRAMPGDPVAELEHRARLAQHDDLRRVQRDLPRAVAHRHGQRAAQAPPAGPGPHRLALAARQHRHQPPAGHPVRHRGDHDDGQRNGDQHQRRGPQLAASSSATPGSSQASTSSTGSTVTWAKLRPARETRRVRLAAGAGF